MSDAISPAMRDFSFDSMVETVGQVLSALLARGEFASDNPAWDLLKDDEVFLATNSLLSQLGARLSMTNDRCYLVPKELSSPLLRGTPKMADVFRDQGKDEPGRANLQAMLTLLILRKLLDPRSEDGLSQAGRGGIVPVETMVNECEDALATLARQEGLSDYMLSALDEWNRSSKPATGRPNVSSHEGHVRYVLSALARKGVVNLDNGDAELMAYFAPTARLVAQAREVLDSERYQEIASALEGEES